MSYPFAVGTLRVQDALCVRAFDFLVLSACSVGLNGLTFGLSIFPKSTKQRLARACPATTASSRHNPERVHGGRGDEVSRTSDAGERPPAVPEIATASAYRDDCRGGVQAATGDFKTRAESVGRHAGEISHGSAICGVRCPCECEGVVDASLGRANGALPLPAASNVSEAQRDAC